MGDDGGAGLPAAGHHVHHTRREPGLPEHLGEQDAADAILAAVERTLSEGGPRTRDLGGNAGTMDAARAITGAL